MGCGDLEVGKGEERSVKYVVYASAPMSVDKLLEAIRVFGPVLTQTYGQAEACMICTFFSPADHVAALESNKRHRLASCGKVSPLVRLEVMDETGKLLPRGERGEIVVRGALIMAGYFKKEASTKQTSAFGLPHLAGLRRFADDSFLYHAHP